jgi:hypothetical protein
VVTSSPGCTHRADPVEARKSGRDGKSEHKQGQGPVCSHVHRVEGARGRGKARHQRRTQVHGGEKIPHKDMSMHMLVNRDRPARISGVNIRGDTSGSMVRLLLRLELRPASKGLSLIDSLVVSLETSKLMDADFDRDKSRLELPLTQQRPKS